MEPFYQRTETIFGGHKMKVGDLVLLKWDHTMGVVTKIHPKKSGHRIHTIDVVTTTGFLLSRRVPDLFKVIYENR